MVRIIITTKVLAVTSIADLPGKRVIIVTASISELADALGVL